MDRKVRITIRSGIRPGSGLGSSAAPAPGTAVAINELFSLGYSKEELVWIAAKGEVAAAGIMHADNVAPCIMGDLAIVCDKHVEHVEMPPVSVVAILPEIVVSTREARAILPQQVPVREMVQNVGKASMLMAGVIKRDPVIIGRSLTDTFNERYRSPLIKGYDAVRTRDKCWRLRRGDQRLRADNDRPVPRKDVFRHRRSHAEELQCRRRGLGVVYSRHRQRRPDYKERPVVNVRKVLIPSTCVLIVIAMSVAGCVCGNTGVTPTGVPTVTATPVVTPSPPRPRHLKQSCRMGYG
jgi:hypothetical protein